MASVHCLLGVILLFVFFVQEIQCTSSAEEQFSFFRSKFGKNYRDEAEKNHRFSIFRDNLKLAKKQNLLSKKGARYGVTKFMDLTPTEFSEKYLRSMNTVASSSRSTSLNRQDLPKQFDWRTKGDVGPVYNQAQDGGAAVYAIVENVESMNAIETGNLVSLEGATDALEQCAPDVDDIVSTWTFVKQHGLYDGGPPINCNNLSPSFNISNWYYVTKSKDETAMMNWVYNNGTIAACVDASTWQTYEGGIVSTDCEFNQIDHCVQIVGWEFSLALLIGSSETRGERTGVRMVTFTLQSVETTVVLHNL
jgi:cathepsin F